MAECGPGSPLRTLLTYSSGIGVYLGRILAGWRVGSKWLSWAKGSGGPSTEKKFFHSKWLVRPFVVAGRVQPTLDPSAETVDRSNALPQKRGGELVGACECVRDVQGEEG